MSFKTMTLDGQRYVLVPADEFALLSKGAPLLPPADADGNRPALAFINANIARTLVRDRTAVGMSQRELADAAGIRPEILNRAERGAVVPSTRTLAKIDAALTKAGLQRGTPKRVARARLARRAAG